MNHFLKKRRGGAALLVIIVIVVILLLISFVSYRNKKQAANLDELPSDVNVEFPSAITTPDTDVSTPSTIKNLNTTPAKTTVQEDELEETIKGLETMLDQIGKDIDSGKDLDFSEFDGDDEITKKLSE